MVKLSEVREIILEQFHNRIQRYKLTEGYKSKNDFDVAKVVSPASIKRWSDKSEKAIFKAAKANDKTALEYIFYRMKGAITGTFWQNYLGPNGQIRKYRIQNEDAWEQWLSICWMAMTEGFNELGRRNYDEIGNVTKQFGAKGALSSFNPEKAKEGTLFNIFSSRYKRILINASKEANASNTGGGLTHVEGGELVGKVSQYEPTWAEKGHDDDGDDLGTSGGGYDDPSFDTVNNNIETDEFLKKWQIFTQDPALQANTKGVTVADVFFEAIDNPEAELRAMGTKLGISRNSCATLLAKAQDIMASHGVQGPDLMKAIKTIGNDKVASYLKKAEPVGEEESPPPPKEEPTVPTAPADTGDWLTNFETTIADPKFWETVRNLDGANAIYYWIDSGFKEPEEICQKQGLRKTDYKYFLNQALKLLKKNGISQEDIKQQVKKHGKQKITGLIGEDNDE